MEDSIVRLSTFIGFTILCGILASRIRSAPLLGHILAGALLGPPLANFLSPSISQGLQLFGLLGVWLAVIDAGLGTSLPTLWSLAPRASLIAVVGILFPIAGSLGVVAVTHVIRDEFEIGRTLRAGASVGAAIAPTSLGVVAQLLADHAILEEEVGKLISIAAVVDDVLSLILLAEITVLAEDSPSGWQLAKPAVLSSVFVGAGFLFASLVPHVLRVSTKLVPPRHRNVYLSVLVALATSLTWAAEKAGTSFLLAAYLTGIAFAAAGGDFAIYETWSAIFAPFLSPLLMLFFAATIGFAIPRLGVLFDSNALSVGAILGLVAIFGKILCGICAPNFRRDGLLVGVSMLGRGEFGFLIASEAFKLGLLDDRLYAAAVWGVLIPIIVLPFIFAPVARTRKKKLEAEGAGEATPSVVSPENMSLGTTRNAAGHT